MIGDKKSALVTSDEQSVEQEALRLRSLKSFVLMKYCYEKKCFFFYDGMLHGFRHDNDFMQW